MSAALAALSSVWRRAAALLLPLLLLLWLLRCPLPVLSCAALCVVFGKEFLFCVVLLDKSNCR
jgi:hypothetical protein